MRENRSTLGCFITTTTTTPLKIPPHSHSRYSFMSSQLHSCIPHIDVDQGLRLHHRRFYLCPPPVLIFPYLTWLRSACWTNSQPLQFTLLAFWCKDVQNMQQFLDGWQLMSRLESFITSGPVPPIPVLRTLAGLSSYIATVPSVNGIPHVIPPQ
ncbi:hypothetical protein M405DRAFT_813690 [Rhizopogon salebrosus TDB-379]|nr:hypothetical protein M405DRAFT_813690 [Rhizopogon salebrosus TDB-379]